MTRQPLPPLTPTAWQVLDDRRAANGSADEMVFGYRSFASPFRAAVKRAGLRGVNIRTVQRWLGHTSVTHTERYTHPSPAYERQTILVLDRPQVGLVELNGGTP